MTSPSFRHTLPALVLLAVVSCRPSPASAPAASPDAFLGLLTASAEEREAAFDAIEASWRPGSAVMALEVAGFSRDPLTLPRLIALLERRTGQELGADLQAWYEWIWANEPPPEASYADFKSRLYRQIDPRFAAYFSSDRTSRIRLDEVRWGGVRQDGIPPLRSPAMISAAEAGYLDDEHVVFGIEVNGDARAYPKRILAWHEMFVDTVGGVPVTGVYCTLCGTVILYDSVHGGVHHELGTSGFLYRSNKLMYDRATQSLWNTLWGRPVIGPLADRSIELPRRSVVTTTWGEWRRRHPETLVLSLDTGHVRDYSEGAAYREYFATDELMFNVPKLDRRLKNKDEVLAVVLPEAPGESLAVAERYLREHPVYHDSLGDVELVVLTDPSGANRVYATSGVRFARWDGAHTVTDAAGESWRLSEAALTHADGRSLPRLPSQRAFWFGWFSAYPQTRLVR